ncbi:hypothetical protein EVAR_57359_1 [Eumeta japonica]|uniref:Uncharacterized protein n=1 Tax=Eumeta variegata TaxID=151549 RepID=A0A4C1ZEM7_EUMVA|nr:hypothetical protein EVAR_57359_1 [Eumeta japonica]
MACGRRPFYEYCDERRRARRPRPQPSAGIGQMHHERVAKRNRSVVKHRPKCRMRQGRARAGAGGRRRRGARECRTPAVDTRPTTPAVRDRCIADLAATHIRVAPLRPRRFAGANRGRRTPLISRIRLGIAGARPAAPRTGSGASSNRRVTALRGHENWRARKAFLVLSAGQRTRLHNGGAGAPARAPRPPPCARCSRFSC